MVFFWLNLRLFILERSASRAAHNSGGTSATTTATVAGGASLDGGGAGASGGVTGVEDNIEATAATSEYGGIAVVDNVRYRKFSKFALLLYGVSNFPSFIFSFV